MIDLFYLDDSVKKGDIKELASLKDKKIWIDATDITKKEADILKEAFDLHPLTVEDIVNVNTRIKVEEFPNYLFCVFYGVQKSKTIETVEIDLLLGKNLIISNHKNEVSSISSLKQDIQKLEALFKKGDDFLFHHLLDIEIDNYFPVLEKIDDQVEDIEEEITKNTRPEILSRILKLKRKIVMLKKIVLPQREKISFLTKRGYSFISNKALPYFRDIYDHAIRVSDTIDNYREAVSNTFDVYMSAVSNNMNEVMKTLSIIATIALPLTVISGVYGTNFSVLPGQHFVYGFWAMITLMVIVSVGMLLYFKKKHWF